MAEGPSSFKNPEKTNAAANKAAHAHTTALGSVITGTLRSPSRFARVMASDHPTRIVPTHKTSISASQVVMRIESEAIRSELERSAVVKTFGDFQFDDRRRRLSARGQPVR